MTTARPAMRVQMKKIKQLVLLLALQLISTPIFAAVWSDMWWNPSESGWGVNVSQQGGVMFLTFFVYAPDGTPKWYTAAVYRGAAPATGYAAFHGDMYETRGPWFGTGFNPAAVQARKVGSVTFAPLTPYSATLLYSVDGVQVTKSIQRQTWQHINLSGRYAGAYTVRTTTCPGVLVGAAGYVNLDLLATVGPDGVSGTLTSALAFDGSAAACLLSGTYRQFGSVYNVINGAACAAGGASGLLRVDIRDLSKTDEGVDGDIEFTGPGCRAGVTFSAVQYQ
jgi:hypothetical protein